MEHLDDVSVDDLQRALDEVEGKKPAQRLIAAIAYKNGVTQTELAEWYGVQRRTIYSWLTRLEDQPLERAAVDEHRPGRPRKLTDAQQRELTATLQESPSEVGYDADWWTPALVRRHLREAFDADYSLPSCRRLMREAGLEYRTSRRPAGNGTDGADADSTDDAESAAEGREERGGRWVLK